MKRIARVYMKLRKLIKIVMVQVIQWEITNTHMYFFTQTCECVCVCPLILRQTTGYYSIFF